VKSDVCVFATLGCLKTPSFTIGVSRKDAKTRKDAKGKGQSAKGKEQGHKAIDIEERV
jgi:hypothetical protein